MIENGYDSEADLTVRSTWHEFIKSHWDVLAACDFFAIELLVGRKKLHIGVNKNGWIMASKVTEGHEQDPCQVPDLLDQIDREIDCFVGDGIYDRETVYEAVPRHSSEASMVVPPRKDAVLSSDSTRVLSQRNQHV